MPSAWIFAVLMAQAAPVAMPAAPPIVMAPTPAPSQTGGGVQVSAREIAQNRAMSEFQQMRLHADPDPRLLALLQQKRLLEESLPAIAHRQPFDATALKRAYGDLARVIGEANARNAELLVEQLAALSPEKRALVIERIPYLAAPISQAPPPPSK